MLFYALVKPKTGTPEDRCAGLDATQAKGTETGGFPKCHVCGYPLGMRTWLPPFRIELETWGEHFGDIASVADCLVVSEKCYEMCTEHLIKGLSGFDPVEVTKIVRRGKRPLEGVPSYFRASVSRSLTIVDQERSGYVWADKSAVCKACLRGGTVKRYAKVVIDESSWDQDDVFWPRGGPCIVVSARFRSLCERNSIHGVDFRSLTEITYDFFPWEI